MYLRRYDIRHTAYVVALATASNNKLVDSDFLNGCTMHSRICKRTLTEIGLATENLFLVIHFSFPSFPPPVWCYNHSALTAGVIVSLTTGSVLSLWPVNRPSQLFFFFSWIIILIHIIFWLGCGIGIGQPFSLLSRRSSIFCSPAIDYCLSSKLSSHSRRTIINLPSINHGTASLSKTQY